LSWLKPNSQANRFSHNSSLLASVTDEFSFSCV
jgi:hypothetical protein